MENLFFKQKVVTLIFFFLICVLNFTEVEKEPKPVKKKVEEEKIIKDTVSCSSY